MIFILGGLLGAVVGAGLYFTYQTGRTVYKASPPFIQVFLLISFLSMIFERRLAKYSTELDFLTAAWVVGGGCWFIVQQLQAVRQVRVARYRAAQSGQQDDGNETAEFRIEQLRQSLTEVA